MSITQAAYVDNRYAAVCRAVDRREKSAQTAAQWPVDISYLPQFAISPTCLVSSPSAAPSEAPLIFYAWTRGAYVDPVLAFLRSSPLDSGPGLGPSGVARVTSGRASGRGADRAAPAAGRRVDRQGIGSQRRQSAAVELEPAGGTKPMSFLAQSAGLNPVWARRAQRLGSGAPNLGLILVPLMQIYATRRDVETSRCGSARSRAPGFASRTREVCMVAAADRRGQVLRRQETTRQLQRPAGRMSPATGISGGCESGRLWSNFQRKP